jgi:IPT/TIG domain/Glucose / Sorbosone dehydrogenase
LVGPSGLTGLEFGDNGEIYIQCASNTNGGVPGRLTGKQVQKDNYYSSATVVASLADPLFNGAITYTAADDGIPNGGYGIDIFAAGTRNPFGICLHSNGNIYASDNGPNFSYGDMMTGCGVGESKPDVTEGDKINLLVKGGYYGQPNRIRALTKNDPRQCVWRSQYEPSGGGYTAPILKTQSSTDGLIEFNGDHFEKQLRGNLIAAKYQGSLYRIILTPDGKGVIPQSDPAIQLTPDVDALDVTQAPDGTLISTSLERNALHFHKPIEQPTTNLKVNSVFPGRGSQVGGNTLKIFGVNFNNPTTVVVGGRTCTVTLDTSTKLECTMPGGSGTVDIVVSSGNGLRYTFARGYRYITGLPL